MKGSSKGKIAPLQYDQTHRRQQQRSHSVPELTVKNEKVCGGETSVTLIYIYIYIFCIHRYIVIYYMPLSSLILRLSSLNWKGWGSISRQLMSIHWKYVLHDNREGVKCCLFLVLVYDSMCSDAMRWLFNTRLSLLNVYFQVPCYIVSWVVAWLVHVLGAPCLLATTSIVKFNPGPWQWWNAGEKKTLCLYIYISTSRLSYLNDEYETTLPTVNHHHTRG